MARTCTVPASAQLALVLLCSAAVAAPSVPLAQGGKTKHVISLAADASPAERNAAAELAAYLKRVTGAEFGSVTPGEAGKRPVIAVGPGAAKAVAPRLDLSKEGPTGLGEDGIVLKSVPPHLVLTGAEGSKRGTLYAVYEFLERQAGVRWWTPTAETVPNRPSLAVGSLDVRYKPPFLYRETLCPAIRPFIWEKTDAVPAFALHMRQNGHFSKIPAAWGGHYTLIGWCHTFESLMPHERYFKEHPEWYSEIGGQRKWQRAQLCLTNEEMIAELTRNVLARIRKEPDAGMISVAQNDWGGNCLCARCRTLDQAEGSPSGSLLHCINKVAEAVEKEFPEFYVETLAYQYTRKPPKSIRPRRNVIVRLSVIERSALQPIGDDANRPLLKDLEAWAAVAPNLYLWDYTANLMHPFTPEPRAPVYGPDLRLYQRMGAISVFCEHAHGTPVSDFDELHTWLLSKLMWNPDQDGRALVGDFLNGYYGPAGKHLQAYLDLLASKVKGHRAASFHGSQDAEWLNLPAMNRAAELFDAAEAAVAASPDLAARVRRARLSLDHQWLVSHAGYRFLAEQKKVPFRGPADLDKAVDQFAQRARDLGATRVGFNSEAKPLDAYLADLRAAGTQVADRFQLAASEAYQAFLSGARVPLPESLSRLPVNAVVDIQEDRMSLFGARRLLDAKASNAAAARIDGSIVTWAVQVRDLPGLGVEGRRHAYAVIRVEATGDRGVAFTGGVYDMATGRNPFGITQRLEGEAGGAPDPNVRTERVGALAEPITDGAYRVYDFGTHDFREGIYLWIGTTGGVDPKVVKAIYVDRFLFARE